MESFYGGLTGAAFVIAKRFDGIDIPQPGDGSGVTEYTYTSNYYAVDEKGDYIVENGSLIQKTADNYRSYIWKGHISDGSIAEGTDIKFPTKLAEGMVQHFKKGAASSSEVGYGEYVIIDTASGLKTPNNPDNGKVFRRGFDISTDLYGAEYIGQIVGPKGEVPELEFGTYDEVLEKYSIRSEKEYEYKTDIVPGYDGSTFADTIKYAYATIRDDFGNAEGCIIGLKIPTLVTDFYANHISTYDKKYLNDDGTGTYHDLVERDEEQYKDGSWEHPFYQKWRINIPKGIHGTDAKKIGIVKTYTMPKGYKYDEFPGATLYNDSRFTSEVITVTESLPLIQESIYDDSEWAKVEYDGAEYFVKKTECYMDMVEYVETDYNTMVADGDEGISKRITIGELKGIERVKFDDEFLTIYYTTGKTLTQPHKLTWVTGLGMDETSKKLYPRFNNNQSGEIFGDSFNYIVESVVTKPTADYPNAPYGHLYVYYAAPDKRGSVAFAYPGEIVGETTEWTDLGVVKGEAGGMHILKAVSSVDELDNAIPPEKMANDLGVINPNAAGWFVAVVTKDDYNRVTDIELYYYDYDKLEWCPLGDIGAGITDPSYIIAFGAEGVDKVESSDVFGLKEKGVWAVTSTILSAY